jgi:hypothetical protein
MYFLFNRTTLPVFVTYLTGALYVHCLWFYKYQHDNRVRSKLFVACQLWWFQRPFWFIPSVLGYIIKENFESSLIHQWNYILLSQMHCVWQVVQTPTVISNNPVQVELFAFIHLMNCMIFLSFCSWMITWFVSVDCPDASCEFLQGSVRRNVKQISVSCVIWSALLLVLSVPLYVLSLFLCQFQYYWTCFCK